MKKPSNIDILQLIATNIRIKRSKLNISQERLAELSDLHRTYIGQIERAEKNLTILSLEKIAKALEVDIADLLN